MADVVRGEYIVAIRVHSRESPSAESGTWLRVAYMVEVFLILVIAYIVQRGYIVERGEVFGNSSILRAIATTKISG